MNRSKKFVLSHIKYKIRLFEEGSRLYFIVLSMDEHFRCDMSQVRKEFIASNGFRVWSESTPELAGNGVFLLGCGDDGCGDSLGFSSKKERTAYVKTLNKAIKEWDRDWEGWPESQKGSADVDDLRAEVKRWKAIAAYLADCHAATAQEAAFTKKYSKCDRKRHASICRNAADMMKTGHLTCISSRRCSSEDGVKEIIARCDEAADACQDGEPK
jgi:hypothetical protein